MGIILWELVSRDVPYKTMNGPQVSIAVLTKQFRPTIPNYCPSNFATLIIKCWSQDPKQRPSFSMIGEKLCEMIMEAKKEQKLGEWLLEQDANTKFIIAQSAAAS